MPALRPNGQSSGPEAPLAPVNLRAERRRRGKSIRAMAAEIGVTPRVLGNAERGVVPRPEHQLAIATAYGLDLVVQWPEEQAA